MYIEFELPTNGYWGMLASYQMAVKEWAQHQNIIFKDKHIKTKYRVTFDQDEHYTVFTLTWNWPFEYRLIDNKW
jgi:hypothetical protein